ncbi:MAG: A/G-specific adenine glycosylase, partial [Deltaproteobacteria bacterium]
MKKIRISNINAVCRALLTWYQENQRDLPWRQTRDSYKIWVSEVMLQQTQVNTVIPYYLKFADKFPTVHALAAANQQAVLKVWEGLGYYSRAR